MLQMRYRTALLLAVILLAVGGLSVYLLERNRSPGNATPAPTERTDRNATPPPDKPVQDKPPVVDEDLANTLAERIRGLLRRDKSPVLVEVVAAYPGATAEEVERQVTVTLEVSMAGMPRLQSLRSKSSAGLSWLHIEFKPGTEYHVARQEVINRLQFIGPLPVGVLPQICARPGGETLRYLLVSPRDGNGRPIYTAHDLKTLQDWNLEREFRRSYGVADVIGSGGAVKRFEIQPDPDRLRRYGITLQQLADAVARSNANSGGDFLVQGPVALNVRSVGLFGGGEDPLSKEVLTAANPRKAAELLRAAELRRLREIRALVVAKVNDRPILVGDLVEGGRTPPDEEAGQRGVVISNRSRDGRIACSGPGPYLDEDAIQGVVLMRQGEDRQLLRGVQDRIRELNRTAGKLLPGVRIEPYYSDLDGGKDALWVYGSFPLNASPEAIAERAREVAKLLREYPEVERVVSQVGPSADGDFQPSNQLLLFVGLKADPDDPAVPDRKRPRPRTELLEEFNRLLSAKVPGIGWLTTTKAPEEMGLAFPGAPAEHLLKVIGPDLNELDRLAHAIPAVLRDVPGMESVAAYRSLGQPHLEYRIDPEKCQKWGVPTADVSAVVQTALGGKPLSQMIEGEKTFEITVRWPQRLRNSETAILDLPLDITSNKADVGDPLKLAPRILLRDLVSPVGKDGEPDPGGQFLRAGAAAIYRAQGRRMLPIRFSVRGRSLVEVRAEAEKKIVPLLKAPYRIEWSD